MVEWVVGGLKVPLTYRWTREVLPTPDGKFCQIYQRYFPRFYIPWAPRTQILASRLLDIAGCRVLGFLYLFKSHDHEDATHKLRE